MPTYEYYCPTCDKEEEVYSHYIIHEKEKKCPFCGGLSTRETFAQTFWQRSSALLKPGKYDMYLSSPGYNNEKQNFNKQKRIEKRMKE